MSPVAEFFIEVYLWVGIVYVVQTVWSDRFAREAREVMMEVDETGGDATLYSTAIARRLVAAGLTVLCLLAIPLWPVMYMARGE